MGFWDFFKSKKKDESESGESPLPNIGSDDLIFAKNFTNSGGRFIFIDEINSTKEVFEKIFKENQWNPENVCSLDANVAKNLQIRSIRKIDNKNVKALVTECEFLISNTGRILICNKQIKSNKIEDLPSVLIVLAKSNQFVSDVSEGMTQLKSKYKSNFPANITTLNVKNKLNEDNFLTYGNSAKDIYLILSDD
ncbi:LUD domain-containing protein [Flavobacteriaceae bacterium]|nr:LUD domain-containing protein [Flavobacteriaceae bacterium]